MEETIVEFASRRQVEICRTMEKHRREINGLQLAIVDLEIERKLVELTLQSASMPSEVDKNYSAESEKQSPKHETTIREDILRVLKDASARSVAQIVQEIGRPPKSTTSVLAKLVEAGILVRAGRGIYRVAEAA